MHTTDQLNTALAGRYAIERRVGEGGMATVYLARDLRHNRKVALKVLKPDLGAVVGVDRFLAEIEVTANLQHPNLLPLFDSGAADGLLFYVMPFVEGESLRARLEREKQLPVDEAVRIATAVAGALDYAHARGVIHRDLKPENILLQHGQPVVADFGIALAVSNAGGNRITQTGLSLGTPQYMSPEQATGDRQIDARTDVYSLGAVAYEMLTGDPPHTGSSSQAVIARLLTEKPRAMRTTRPNVPAHVEAAVERALEKLPADRFASARELADALSGRVMVTSSAATASAPVAGGRTGRSPLERWLVVTLGLALIAVAALGIALQRRSTAAADAPDVQFEIATPPAVSPLQLSISPDGRFIVFAARTAQGQSGLMLRPLGSTTATWIPGTEGTPNNMSFWSPDSRQIGFLGSGKMYRATIGSPPTIICDVTGSRTRGATWSAQNVIVFSMDGEIYRVSATGGTPEKLPLSVTGAFQWEWPVFLPDGVHFIVTARGGADAVRGWYVASLDGGKPIRVGAGVRQVLFAPPDYALFLRENLLYAQRLDLRTFALVGDAVRITDDVGVNTASGVIGAAVSATGALVKRPQKGIAFTPSELRWYSRSGASLGAVGDTSGVISEIALAPDERRVAITRYDDLTQLVDVHIVDLASGVTSRLTHSDVSGVLWSPDSRSVTYRVRESGALLSRGIGSSKDSTVFAAGVGDLMRAEDFSRDGRTLILRRPSSGTIFSKDVGSSKAPTELATLGSIDEVRLSPDARFIAYNSRGSDDSGDWQVWVASFPSFENRRQVSPSGGMQPRWRSDGKELYYLAPNGKLMAAAAVPGATPEFRGPVALFQSPLTTPNGVSDQYDVTRDGQRFLFARGPRPDQSEQPPLTVILNWMNALKEN